jgi:hypothetical protein
LISYEDSELLEVPGFPVAQVTPLDRERGSNLPAKLGMVGETDIDIQAPFFKSVFDPVDNFSAEAWISATGIESVTARRDRGSLSHVRNPRLAPLARSPRVWLAELVECLRRPLLRPFFLFA